MIGREETEGEWVEDASPPPRRVADAVARLAASRGWSRRLHGARVHAAWAEIAGERLAQHTEPVRLSGGVLLVRATSSAWAAQIPYVANEIVRRANAVLGEGQVTRVVVARGTGDVSRETSR
jgi:predicted nucleic acid-binding Zn ribbon protein